MFYDGAVTTYSQNKPLKGYFQGQVSLLYGLESKTWVFMSLAYLVFIAWEKGL